MKARNVALTLGLLGLAGFGARSACNAITTHAADETLVGRVWLDHIPTKPNEHCEWFVVVAQTDTEGKGVFARASQFDGAFSVFGWKAQKKGELTIEMLQDGTRHKLKYTATNCDKDGFDYCLEVTGAPKGAARYGSKHGWELGVDDPTELDAALQKFKREELPAE